MSKDTIYRQDAIDAMDECYWSIMGDEPPKLDEKTALYVDLKQAVKRLPAAEPKWIPVTERLPEENQPVLITDGTVMGVCSLVRTDDGYKWENNMGYWLDFDEWKAWMPLPEPYTGD